MYQFPQQMEVKGIQQRDDTKTCQRLREQAGTVPRISNTEKSFRARAATRT